MRPLYCIFLLLLFFSSTQAQKPAIQGKWGVEAGYLLGKIVRHNPRLTPVPEGLSHGFEIAALKQTNGLLPEHRKLRRPELGLGFLFLYHPQQQSFGNVYALYGLAHFNLVRSRWVDLLFRLGSGIALSPVRHHPVSNPENNAIGSVLNSFNLFGLRLKMKPTPDLHISLSGLLLHYSNGNVQRPNLGINVPTAQISLQYFPGLSQMELNRSPVDKPLRPNEWSASFSIGIQEYVGMGGPKYPVYGCAITYSRYTSVINKVMGGWAMEYNMAYYSYYRFFEEASPRSPSLNAFNSSVFIGDEVLVGRVGIIVQTGFYIFNPIEWKNNPLYVRLGTRIYLNPKKTRDRHSAFILSHLKSNYFVAQFIEGGAGYSVRW